MNKNFFHKKLIDCETNITLPHISKYLFNRNRHKMSYTTFTKLFHVKYVYVSFLLKINILTFSIYIVHLISSRKTAFFSHKNNKMHLRYSSSKNISFEKMCDDDARTERVSREFYVIFRKNDICVCVCLFGKFLYGRGNALSLESVVIDRI